MVSVQFFFLRLQKDKEAKLFGAKASVQSPQKNL